MKYLVVFLLLAVAVFGEPEIILNDGSVIKGEISSKTDSVVVVKTAFGLQSIPMSSVQEIKDIKPNTISLKDGSKIQGKIISSNEGKYQVKTSYGEIEIPEDQIENIMYEQNRSNEDAAQEVTFETANGLENIGKSMLYSTQKKSVATALGLEMLGGGLLYAEKTTPGILMLIAETGLIMSPAFTGDPDLATGLFLAGLGLKTVNTVWTINAVNEYNKTLRVNLGIEANTEKARQRNNTKRFLVIFGGGFAPPEGLMLQFPTLLYQIDSSWAFGFSMQGGFIDSGITEYGVEGLRTSIAGSYRIGQSGPKQRRLLASFGLNLDDTVTLSGSLGYLYDLFVYGPFALQPEVTLYFGNGTDYVDDQTEYGAYLGLVIGMNIAANF